MGCQAKCTQHLLPSCAHSCFSAPSLGSSCKTHRRELSGSKYCYFNRLVWGFCWCISTGDEHDFGLIVMATVAAVLVSPCEHRPGQAPAYEPWTGSDTAGSFFYSVYFSLFPCDLCTQTFPGWDFLGFLLGRGCQGKVGWAAQWGLLSGGKDQDEQQELIT